MIDFSGEKKFPAATRKLEGIMAAFVKFENVKKVPGFYTEYTKKRLDNGCGFFFISRNSHYDKTISQYEKHGNT